jgi:hypothetical protein
VTSDRLAGSGLRTLLVEVLGWWEEGDRVLGAALVAAKATEVRMRGAIGRRSDQQEMYDRAVRRVRALEQAISDMRKEIGS